jgi:Protein of unknown function (DUF2946)
LLLKFTGSLVAVPAVGAHGATAMHWFRSRAKGYSFLALFALLLQLALSFSHLHLDAAVSGARHSSKIFAVDNAAAPISAVDPASQDLPEHGDDYCAICGVIHLARSVILSPAPSLLPPATYARAQFAPQTHSAAAEPSRTPFQARAPPIT